MSGFSAKLEKVYKETHSEVARISKNIKHVVVGDFGICSITDEESQKSKIERIISHFVKSGYAIDKLQNYRDLSVHELYFIRGASRIVFGRITLPLRVSVESNSMNQTISTLDLTDETCTYSFMGSKLDDGIVRSAMMLVNDYTTMVGKADYYTLEHFQNIYNYAQDNKFLFTLFKRLFLVIYFVRKFQLPSYLTTRVEDLTKERLFGTLLEEVAPDGYLDEHNKDGLLSNLKSGATMQVCEAVTAVELLEVEKIVKNDDLGIVRTTLDYDELSSLDFQTRGTEKELKTKVTRQLKKNKLLSKSKRYFVLVYDKETAQRTAEEYFQTGAFEGLSQEEVYVASGDVFSHGFLAIL